MKSMFLRGLAVALGVAGTLSSAYAQNRFGSPTLLPMPQAEQRYPISQTAAFYQPQPAEAPMPAEGSAEQLPAFPENSLPMGSGVQPSAVPHEMHDGHVMHGEYPSHVDGAHHGGCQSCGNGYAPAATPSYGYTCGSGCGHHGWLSGLWAGRRLRNPLCRDIAYVSAGQPRCGWFGGAAGLIMTRDNEDHYQFSFGSAAEQNQLLNTRDAEMEYSGGAEAFFGRYFCCGRMAWEVRYWGIYPDEQETLLTSGMVAGNLDAILNFDQLEIGGIPVENWVNNADAHRLRRNYEFNNFEFNILNYSGCAGYGACCNRRFNINWGYGFRYFRFSEDLEFATRENGTGINFTGGQSQVMYNVETDNNLFGFQGTCDIRYDITCKLGLNIATKFGLFANYIDHSSRIHANGLDAVVDNGPNLGRVWNIASNKDDVAFLGELKVGLDYQLSCRWALNAGYRAMAVSGVALPSEQIPSDLRGIDDALFIDSNASLILHGAYFGAEYNF